MDRIYIARVLLVIFSSFAFIATLTINALAGSGKGKISRLNVSARFGSGVSLVAIG